MRLCGYRPVCIFCGKTLAEPEKNDAICPECDAEHYGLERSDPRPR
jgi:hypothetical protein